jgi:hypothetical protein
MASLAWLENGVAKLGCSRIARTMTVIRHPEVLDQGASLEGDGRGVTGRTLRGSLRSHLRVTDLTKAGHDEARMKNVKQKSSGWRPVKERGPWRERSARQALRQAAEFRRECDQAHLWKACPSARCQRARGCMGQNPFQCWQNHRAKEQQAQLEQRRLSETPAVAAAPRRRNGLNTSNGLNAARLPLSPKEAAALIAASIAAEPPESL